MVVALLAVIVLTIVGSTAKMKTFQVSFLEALTTFLKDVF